MANPSDSKPSASIYLQRYKFKIIFFNFLSFEIDLPIIFIDFEFILVNIKFRINYYNSPRFCMANPNDSKLSLSIYLQLDKLI